MSAWIADAGLLALGAEALWRLTRGRRPPGWAANLMAGACLMAALRVALGEGWDGWVGLCLTGAALAHVAELRARR